jgi:signal peptidase I
VIEPAGPASYDPVRDPFETQLEPLTPRRVDGRTELPGQAGPYAGPVAGGVEPEPVPAYSRRDAGYQVGYDPLAGGSRLDLAPAGATRSQRSGSSRSSSSRSGSSGSRAQPSGSDRLPRIGPRHDTRDRGLFRRRSIPAAPPVPVSRGRAAFSAVTEIVVVLVMALVLSFVIKTFLVQAFFIPSESMYTTLLKGDRVLVSKLTPGPLSLHRGDVVVFRDPGGWLPAEVPTVDSPVRGAVRQTLTFIGLLPTDSGEHLIKRVIGLPGDTVACCDATGRVTVNGVPIDETPYLNAGDQPSTLTFKVTVPPDSLWVMGDHRAVSEDSRRHQELRGGFIRMGDVVGRAFVIVWPFERVGGVSVPGTVFDRVPDPPAPR